MGAGIGADGGGPGAMLFKRSDDGGALGGLQKYKQLNLFIIMGLGEFVERVKGIEPSSGAWEALALPLSYTRDGT